MPLAVGIKGQASLLVDQSHTAKSFGIGSIPVLGLPALVALMERAAANAVRPHLEEGQDSVGVVASVRQFVPIGLNRHLRAEAIVAGIDGKRVTFSVTVQDLRERVAEGSLERSIVDREEFIWGAASRGL